MGAGVAELKDQLVEVKKQLATAVLPTAKRVELLAQKAALEAELKAAQAKKSADSVAAGAYGLFCSFFERALLFPPRLLPHAPRPNLTQNTLCRFLPSLLCRARGRLRRASGGRRDGGAD